MLKQESTEQATDELFLGTLRVRRRRLVPALAGVLAMAIIAVAVGVATRPQGHRARQITSLGDQAPGTTVTAVPVTTVPDAARPSPTDPPAAGPTPSTTPAAGSTPPTPTAPSPAIAPDRSRPTGMNYTPEALWPETLAELDGIQATVDQGHQPWRNDPVEVARAYLADRGSSGATIGQFRATGQGAGSVDYTVGGMGGRVDLQRLLNGSIWYVAGSRSAAFPGLQVDRKGRSVVVVAHSGADGLLTARAKHPGGAWGADQRVQAFAGGSRSMTLEAAAGASPALIVQLRLDGDRRAGVAETYVGPGVGSVRYSAVESESRLRVDGLGPVRIGMSLEEARAAAGLAMVLREGPGCVDYRTEGPPAGVSFVSAGSGQRLDLITVSEPSIATVSGIKVGSTLAEVRRAYGDKLAGSLQDGWGKLLFRPDDKSLDHLALALLFSEGKVAAMWAGLRVLVQADEVCA